MFLLADLICKTLVKFSSEDGGEHAMFSSKPGTDTFVDKLTIISNLFSQHLVLNMFNFWLKC